VFQNEVLSQTACAKNILITSNYIIRFRRDQRLDTVPDTLYNGINPKKTLSYKHNIVKGK